jgi:[ribosomal protein S5]-alanine N-acetyltransferase
MPSLPELREPLTDGTVAVRPAAERDIPEVLIAYQDDPSLHLRMGQVRPPSGAELGRRAERAEPDRVAGRRLTLTVIEPGDDTCCGQIHVRGVDWDNSRAELGIWVAPQRRGRGLGTRALALVATWLLRDAGLHRIGLVAEADNERLIRAARSAGFSHEAVLRGYTRTRNGRVDNAVLSMVGPDLRG